MTSLVGTIFTYEGQVPKSRIISIILLTDLNRTTYFSPNRHLLAQVLFVQFKDYSVISGNSTARVNGLRNRRYRWRLLFRYPAVKFDVIRDGQKFFGVGSLESPSGGNAEHSSNTRSLKC